MNALLEDFRRSPSAFADGLASWLAREDGLEAEVAGIVVAETILFHRAWAQAQQKR